MYTLDERNGWLYVKEVTNSFCEPVDIIHYWPTGMRYANFASWFASPERAHEALGKPVTPISNASYQDERGWTYRLPSGGETKPDHTETMPIPEPKQRGKKFPLRWQKGRWEKETKRGWGPA
jgi:hypothetical protein